MGAGSFLALVARHSLLPVRHSSRAPAQVHNITPHAQFAEQQLLCNFQVDLADRLQQLQLHNGSGNAHLNWLIDALVSTLSTHSSLQSVLTAAASSSAASVATVAKQRADEVLYMLDVCTSLKQVVDDMDRQFGSLQHALQSVGTALNSEKPLSSGRIRAAACRLSACLMKDRPDTYILCITGKQYRPLAEARVSLLLAAKRELHSDATTDPAATLLSQAIDGAMLTSLLVLASAVSILAPPSPRKSSGAIAGACKMIIKYLGAKTSEFAAWAAPLRQLHRDLRQEEMSGVGGSLFQELKGLHSAATNLHAIISSPGVHGTELGVVKDSVESMRERLQEAQGCMAMFRMHMASFFQALVALRLALLDSANATSPPPILASAASNFDPPAAALSSLL